MKQCATCKEYKDLSEFHKNYKTKDKKQYNCKTCQIKISKDYSKQNPDKVLFGGAKYRAKKYGGKITITPNWILKKLQAGICELTGLPFDFSKMEGQHKNPYSPSLDRIDSKNRDYTPENTRVVLTGVNMALNEQTLETMKPIFKALAEL